MLLSQLYRGILAYYLWFRYRQYNIGPEILVTSILILPVVASRRQKESISYDLHLSEDRVA